LPENELAAAAGIAMDKSTGGPITDAWLQTSVPGIFACGNALHIHDLADNASEEGELAGCTAARIALGLGSEPSLPFPRIQEHDTVLKDMAPPSVGNGSKPLRTPDASSAPNNAKTSNTSNTPSTLTLVCVRCPKGCELQLALTPDGALAEVQGEGCRLGLAYAEEEVTAPKRIVTASLGIAGSLEPLSVKTAAPVLRTQIFAVLDEIRALKLRVPIQAGTKLVENIASTGAAVFTLSGSNEPAMLSEAVTMRLGAVISSSAYAKPSRQPSPCTSASVPSGASVSSSSQPSGQRTQTRLRVLGVLGVLGVLASSGRSGLEPFPTGGGAMSLSTVSCS
jgi:CxxC motif-containing protein